MARDANAEAAEQLPGQRSGGHAGGGLARAGALEHVADVVVTVLDRAGEIGVARPRARDVGPVLRSGRAFRHLGLDVHRLLPVHPVAIADQQRDRRAGGDAVADAGEDLGAVAFDLHAAAAAVAALAAAELSVERVDIELEARGHAVHGDDQRLAVRLASGQKSQHSSVILYDPPSRPGWRSALRRGRSAFALRASAGQAALVRRSVPESADFDLGAIGRNCASRECFAPDSLERSTPSSRLHLGHGMSRLLHDRYCAYASSHAWDLTTGESVRVDAIAADDAEPPAPASLVEVLDHGREGEPRWVVADNANGPRSPVVARRVAAAARARGYVPIAADVYLRLRDMLDADLAQRTLLLIVQPVASIAIGRAALVDAAARWPRPHVLLSFASPRASRDRSWRDRSRSACRVRRAARIERHSPRRFPMMC